jgi:hypothetical protein
MMRIPWTARKTNTEILIKANKQTNPQGKRRRGRSKTT